MPTLLTLAEAAARLQWSRRILRARLAAYQIPTVGTGRRARLREANFNLLIELERGLPGFEAAISVDDLRDRPRDGFVYAVQAKNGGAIKIGFSTDQTASARLESLQTGNPEKLVLLASAEASMAHERRAHALLASQRVGGEWFRDGPLLRQFISMLRAGDIMLALTWIKPHRNGARTDCGSQ